MSYRYFLDNIILAYDQEAKNKNWKTTKMQELFFYLADKYNRLSFKSPREHLKTSTVLNYLIYKLAIRPYPLEILYFHISDEIANEKFNKLKRLIENNPLLNISFSMNASSWTKSSIELKDGSIIKPVSYNSASLGRHPHIIVLDDVIDSKILYSDNLNRKAIDKFYTEIYPMMSRNDPNKQMIIIGTVQRKDDLYHNLPPDFQSFTWRAIKSDGQPLSPELYSLEDLKEIERKISAKYGNKYWLKEYMNMPFEAMGLIIKPEDIRYYKTAPDNLEIYQGWDLSVGKDIEKGDYTSGMTIGVDKTLDKIRIYVLDIFRSRIDFNTRLAMVEQKNRDWKPLAIGIESNAFQYDLVKQLKDRGLPVVEIKSIKNKIESFQVELAPYFENEQVFIKEYMSELKNELLSLPTGEHDDMADSLKFAIKTALMPTANLSFYTLKF